MISGSFATINKTTSDYADGNFQPYDGMGIGGGSAGGALYPFRVRIEPTGIRVSSVNHGKQKGVKYIIKVL